MKHRAGIRRALRCWSPDCRVRIIRKVGIRLHKRLQRSDCAKLRRTRAKKRETPMEAS